MHSIEIVFIVIRMLGDLVTGGDPTLPGGYPELIPVARILAHIYDLLP